MREIKFRVWDKEENKFWYFILQKILERRMYYRGSWDVKVLRGEKTQYTGLKDINDKEIYEGDIVKYKSIFDEDGEFSIGEVIFHLGMFTVKGAIKWLGDDCEVIGNIYENPELLEVE